MNRGNNDLHVIYYNLHTFKLNKLIPCKQTENVDFKSEESVIFDKNNFYKITK